MVDAPAFGQFDWGIVILSIGVSLLASYAAVELSDNLNTRVASAKGAWLWVFSLATGGGIWAMHFIGMLAVRLSVPPAFTFRMILLAFIAPVALAALGLSSTRWLTSRVGGSLVGGVLLGLGIIATHHAGMASMRANTKPVYGVLSTAVSSSVAVFGSAAFFWATASIGTFRSKLLGIASLSTAIAGMHYLSADGEMSILDGAMRQGASSRGMATTSLSVVVAVVTTCILMMALLVSTYMRRLEGLRLRESTLDALRDSSEQLQLLQDAAAMGAWDWDLASDRVILSAQLLVLLDLDATRPTLAFDDFILAMVHADDVASVRTVLRAAAESGRKMQVDFRRRNTGAQGDTRWLVARGKTIFRAPPQRATRMVGATIDITERKRVEAERHELADRLMSLQDDERRRIARELHDGTAQHLVALSLSLTALDNFVPPLPSAARAVLSTLQADLSECLDELRSMTYLLHPPLIDDFGLFVALDAYCNGFAKRSGLAVIFAAESSLTDLRPPRQIGTALFRIVQESLANAQKHSGCTRVDVGISWVPGELGMIALEVRDDGAGVPRQILEAFERDRQNGLWQLGVGLLGMAERLRDLGGRFDLQAPREGGTIVRVIVQITDPGQRVL